MRGRLSSTSVGVIALAATQGAAGDGDLQVSSRPRVARSQLGEPFAIEDERPAHGYSSSGHAAPRLGQILRGDRPMLHRPARSDSYGKQIHFELPGDGLGHVSG